jgi:hypothetical protein
LFIKYSSQPGRSRDEGCVARIEAPLCRSQSDIDGQMLEVVGPTRGTDLGVALSDSLRLFPESYAGHTQVWSQRKGVPAHRRRGLEKQKRDYKIQVLAIRDETD